MKKSELVVGEDYAVGASPHRRYGGWDCARARVIALAGEAPEPSALRRMRKGIVFEVVEAGRIDYHTVEVGRTFAIQTAVYVRMPWAVYERQREAVREGEAKQAAEKQRQDRLAASQRERLEALGFETRGYGIGLQWTGRGRWQVDCDVMEKLLAMVPAAGGEESSDG